MSDLIQITQQLKKDIDSYCVEHFKDEPRSHLGASIIGKPCKRAIWYDFRWYTNKVHSGRMYRLFNRGQEEESRIKKWLIGIGAYIKDINLETNKQYICTAVDGHFGGSCDGFVLLPYDDKWRLLEDKTHGDKSYVDLLRKGVKNGKPQHWAQMCVYGYLFGADEAVYFPVNKNDDSIEGIEIVKLDIAYGESLVRDAEQIIYSDNPPPKISDRADWFECKMCDHNAVCHKGEAADVTCRSCKNASPQRDDGKWLCDHWGEIIPDKAAQLEACDAYEAI